MSRLEPGGRFPNFAFRDIAGQRCEFYRDITHGPSAVFYLRSPIDLPAFPDGANRIVILPSREMLGAITSADPRDRLLIDGGRRLARHFADQVNETEDFVAITDANQRIVDVRVDPSTPALLAWGHATLAAEARNGGHLGPPPVLVLPRVFEREFCDALIALWADRHEEGRISAAVDGKPASLLAPDFKKRLDHRIAHGSAVYDRICAILARKVSFDLAKAYCAPPLAPEGFYIAGYEADRGDFFGAHRDNNSPATARRRFAVSINLNDDFEGGGVTFPEFTPDALRPPAGAALIFSCSLMHEALPVACGRRMTFLGFLSEPES